MRPYPPALKQLILKNKDAIIERFGQDKYDIWSKQRPEKRESPELVRLFTEIDNKAAATAQEEK